MQPTPKDPTKMGLAFGVNTLCRFCKGKGKKKEAKCPACGGVGFTEEPTARNTDPSTSHEAAEDARAHSGRHRAMALEALRKAGPSGLTDFELADATGVAQTSIGVRRKELVNAGLVEATAERRPAPSGSAAIVWRVVA